MKLAALFITILSICPTAFTFTTPQGRVNINSYNLNNHQSRTITNSKLYAGPPPPPTTEKEETTTSTTTAKESNNNEAILSLPTKGGYTLKQRLREEIDSPFRKVRLAFFGASFASALLALYFSATNTLKAYIGGYENGIPLDEALTSDAINVGAAVVCGLLTYRDWKAGQTNLEKLARAGKLASLVVEPADGASRQKYLEIKSYRRDSRVLIAAGGKEYLTNLALSLSSDQLSDTNILPQRLQDVDVVLVPVLLEGQKSKIVVGDTQSYWKNEVLPTDTDRNFDINRANNVIAFPQNSNKWLDYLKFDIDTASKQGFDVVSKGITLTVKKNGKILRRATGLPPFGDLIGTMEVMDGSKFGMPGDGERYGGP